MKEIHNTYCHFDWYNNFIIVLVGYSAYNTFMKNSSIAHTFRWSTTKQGMNYWHEIATYLRNHNLRLTTEQTATFNTEALRFYTTLYKELKLTNPELFI